ncbi:chemotaxis protein CheA [Ruficoccus amylovorans]|uniref:Chemotaxis protein CheA n=1 Tax=Ruficoccus amylovorans TaxID=1804625 RepID=A0A842HF02_9BACT|nr:chemotaxis protein CheA [Ruficoccus amylovorans]MBC2595002.1 chemotaxis protein CheA [Ruficoccus amylovorans]
MDATDPLDTAQALVESLAAELALMECGSADGLVPAYSLMSELAEAMNDYPQVETPLTALRERISRLLDCNGVTSMDLMVQLTAFVDTIRTVLRFLRADIEVPWSELEWTPPATAAETIPQGPAPAPDAQEADWLGPHLEENRDILEEFFAEAQEHLDQIESALLTLEKAAEDREAISALFRSFHTIKGVAGFLDLFPIQGLAHQVETVLDLLRSDYIAFTPALASLVLESRDRLEGLLAALAEFMASGRRPSSEIPVEDLINRAKAIADETGTDDVSDPADASQMLPFPMPGSLPASAPEESADAVQNVAVESLLKKSSGAAQNVFIRINADKLDSIVDAVGELVIVESQLRESLDRSGIPSAFIERSLGQLGRVTRELQRTGLSLRMVPLRGLFQKMQRLVRDLAVKNGKQVELECIGEDAEMDRNVVEEINDPLVHMIRNAIDHGVEMPEARIKAGKHAGGKICLSARYHGDSIVIELKDDGRGVDTDRVLQKAIERELARPGVQYSEREILDFLFEPGFSTAENITELSGRGVGMDVLRKNITKLRGTIDVSTLRGKGTTVRINLPLTLAIIDGLLLRVEEERYVLPIGSVLLTVKPKAEDIFSIAGQGRLLKHHGTLYPLVDLATYFQIRTARKSLTEGVVILVESDGFKFGLVADELMHKQEIVIKKLVGCFANPDGVSGGAVLGDGSVALVIDPGPLGDRVRDKRTA